MHAGYDGHHPERGLNDVFVEGFYERKPVIQGLRMILIQKIYPDVFRRELWKFEVPFENHQPIRN